MTPKTKSFLIVLLCFAAPLLVGAFASLATASSVGTWYATLNKPFFNPPNWLFGPVWTTLYILMGVSSLMVYKRPYSASRRFGLDLYMIQLFFNFTWSFVFFGFQSPGWALVNIVLLWLLLVLMIIHFYRSSSVAAYLQIPYLMWITFATALNAAIWWLN
jgi:translocator protein